MTSVASTSEVLGLENDLDKWWDLPKIKEMKAASSMSMVSGRGNILGEDAKVGLVAVGGVHV